MENQSFSRKKIQIRQKKSNKASIIFSIHDFYLKVKKEILSTGDFLNHSDGWSSLWDLRWARLDMLLANSLAGEGIRPTIIGTRRCRLEQGAIYTLQTQ